MSDLPARWRVVRLGEVAQTDLGKMLDRGRVRGGKQVPYLRNLNVQWGRFDLRDVSDFELLDEELDRFEVRAGDLLVCEGGEIGRCAIWPGSESYIGYQKALHRVRPGADLDARFLRYSLEDLALRGDLARRATGSTIKHLPQVALRALPLFLPPLDEQHRIVAVLEDHLSRLDAAQDYVDAAARRTRCWRRLAIDEAVARSGPESCILADLVDRIEAGRSFGGSAPPAREHEWGVVRVSAMTWGEFRPQENKAVPKAAADPRYEIRPGDLLISRANTTEYVGAPVLVGTTRPRLLLSDKSLRLVPKEGVDPRWLVEVLGTRAVRRQVSALATGTKNSMRNISQANLLSVAVPSPPEQQRRMIESVSEIHDKSSRMQEGLTATSQRASTLRRRVLSAAIAGKL